MSFENDPQTSWKTGRILKKSWNFDTSMTKNAIILKPKVQKIACGAFSHSF